jgi:type IX secretion system PorP/SprF family membrane protein
MIRLLLILPFTFFFGMALAQQDPQFSQYMFNNMSINPGYAGSKDAICLTALHRTQWVGFPGNPNTSLFSVSAPIKPFKINSGIGLTAINDNLAFQKSPGISLSYAYIMNVRNGEGKLGIGMSVGFLSSTFDPKYDWGKGNSDETTVPGGGGVKETGMTYDLGFGVYYRTENLYLGVSSTHLTQSSYKFNQSSSTLTLARHYYLTTGYNLAMQNPAFEVQPSIMLRYDGSSSAIDLNTMVTYNKRIWGGLSYRLSSAIVGLVGLELSNGIRFGYSYDFSVNSLKASTHEIMVNYCFSLVKEKIPHKYRSVRFL